MRTRKNEREKHRERRHLYEIIHEENIESNEQLGKIYAQFVLQVDRDHSPGQTVFRYSSYSAEGVRQSQKKYQEESRYFLGARKASDHSTNEIREKYLKSLSGRFEPNTVEGIVTELAREGKFADIGAAVREGAEAYHKRAVERGMHNLFYAFEYKAILKSLQEKR